MAEVKEQAGKQMTPEKIISETYKEKLKQLGQLSLWLDEYDDIFSDFDPRHYSHRTLSDDFIAEAKKSIKETPSGKLEVTLLIPAKDRDIQIENIIKKRLTEFFQNQYHAFRDQVWNTINLGLFFVMLGIVFMFVTAFILTRGYGESFAITFITIIAEPAGWFLFWEGLNLLVFETRNKKPEMNFYGKMAECSFKFKSY